MQFTDFARERWGPNWAICRSTSRSAQYYDRCISKAEYAKAEAEFRRQYTAEWLRDRHFNAEYVVQMFEALEGAAFTMREAIKRLPQDDWMVAKLDRDAELAEIVINKAAGR